MHSIDTYFFAKIAKDTGCLFNIYRIKKYKSFWLDDNLVKENFGKSFDINNFCYITAEHSNLMDIEVDLIVRKVALAEYYGGEGLGENLGGARVGSYSGLQVKGLGNNGLSGAHSPFKHSNGSLSLLDAISEAVYSKLINSIIPSGAIKIFSIITTGDLTSYCEYSGRASDGRTAGALLVREACLRPAHFLRNHSALTEFEKKRAVLDFERINNLVNVFVCKIQEENIIRVICECVQKTAYNFGYARAIRLAHGSMSPSNITLVGRWLDLSASSFISDCSNYASSENQIPFLEEPQAALSYLIEFSYNISKTTKKNIKPQILTKLYWNDFDTGFKHGVYWSLGINSNNTKLFEPGLSSLVQKASIFICRYKNINPSDCVSFKKYTESVTLPFFKDVILNNKKQSSKLIDIEKCDYIIIISALIASLRRNVFVSIFSKRRFSEHLATSNVSPDKIISESINFFDFIISDIIEDFPVIWLSENFSIKFSIKTRSYVIRNYTKEITIPMNDILNHTSNLCVSAFGTNIKERIEFVCSALNEVCFYSDMA